MAREDECEALLEILEKLYDNDIKRIHLNRKPPEEVRAFLRRRPNLRKLQTALLVILARIRRIEAKASSN
ncbi:MAG: hypothetical protein ACYSTL_00390 [Planctomycetota bacterium]